MKPKRVVVHKTSVYQPKEEQGFRDGAKGIVPGCDLVWLRPSEYAAPERCGPKGIIGRFHCATMLSADEPQRGKLLWVPG